MRDEALARGELLDVEDVSGLLGVGRVTIYRWCREGRLPCLKVGRAWRVRRGALEDFLRGGEIPRTLTGQLGAFLRVPDTIIAIAQTRELLHRLDAAFFEVAESRGGLLAKFHAGEPESDEQDLREELGRRGVNVRQLEAEGRLRFDGEQDPVSGRRAALERLVDEGAAEGRTIWAAFNWTTEVDVQTALRQQKALSEFARRRQVVVKTGVLEAEADRWSPENRRAAQTVHSGTIWLSGNNVSLSRVVPLPSG